VSDRDGTYRFVVCRCSNAETGESQYEVRQLFAGETCAQEVDQMDGSRVTVFRQADGTVVDSAGEFCGEFSDRGEARIHASRLSKLSEVMES